LRIRIEERIVTETRRLDRLKSSYRRLVDRWRKAEVAEA
jgi:hypothetical protein